MQGMLPLRDDGLRGRVAGSYQNSNFLFVTLNLNWKLTKGIRLELEGQKD